MALGRVIWICDGRKHWFSKDEMKIMQRLRILSIQRYYIEVIDGSIDYLPNILCWFAWHFYQWKLLPQNFNTIRFVRIDLRLSSLHHLWNETKPQLPSLRKLDLHDCKSLKSMPDFTGMPNLEYLDLRDCTSLEEVHDSLRCSRKLIKLDLRGCKSLERFPYVNVESLEFLVLWDCSSLNKLPEFFGIMKSELEIQMQFSGIRELPSSIILPQWSHLTELHFSDMNNLGSLPSSICELKDLVVLNVSSCSKIETLPERIGDLEKLEVLDASRTLISRPPSSIIRLNKLKALTFSKEESEDRGNFVFPQVNEGLCSLKYLNLRFCNLIDGGLPEDIGSLSSLKVLDLSGNNFKHLPQGIAQLGALQILDLSNCKRLAQLPEFPQKLYIIDADWSNDWLCNSLFQNISSLQPDISASYSLSLKVFKSSPWDGNMSIPSWFQVYQVQDTSVSVNLPVNWYVSDNFLGFAVCYTGKLNNDITAHLIHLCDDGASSMTKKFALSERPFYDPIFGINFFVIPLAVLWGASKANGKTPNDYGCFRLVFTREMIEFGVKRNFGVRLLYKDELQIGMRRSRHEEGSCSSSKNQRPLLQLFPTSPGL